MIFAIFFNKATFGFPSTVQNLWLNKIEIGQFLYMKYRLIGVNKLKKKINVVKNLLSNAGDKKASPTMKARAKPAKIAYPNKYGLCSSVNTIPSLLANVRGFINFVPLNFFNTNGTPIIVTQKKKADQYENVLYCRVLNPIAKAIPHPKLIPNQNTKVQNLSLVTQLGCVFGFWFSSVLTATSFVKSCITGSYCYINFYLSTIPKIRLISKQMIIMQVLFSLPLLVGNAYAATESNLLKIIALTEQEYNIPKGLLLAVTKTESNLEPYALNIDGRSIMQANKVDALKAIHKALDEGITNIDIGPSQINYRWHKHNFSNVEDMLSPETNIKYAGKLLSELRKTHGNWHKAIRLYHSSKPKYHRQYSRKVVLCWLGFNHTNKKLNYSRLN